MRPQRFLHYILSLLTAVIAIMAAVAPAHAVEKKPNILIIWGDDIGGFNISANNQGMIGYKTQHRQYRETRRAVY